MVVTLDLNSWVSPRVDQIVSNYMEGNSSMLEVFGRLSDLLEHAEVSEILAVLPWWLQFDWCEDLDQWRDSKKEDYIVIRADFMGTAHITDEQVDQSRNHFFGKIYPKMERWHLANAKRIHWPPSMRLYRGHNTVFAESSRSTRRLDPFRILSREERKDTALRSVRTRLRAGLRAMAEIEYEREQG